MTQFVFQRFNAFGWIVHRKLLAEGDRFEVSAPDGLSMDNASDVAVWTRGRVLVEDVVTGVRLPDRLPGDSILRRGSTRAGRFLCTAVEPSEFWCINHIANRRRRPKLDLLDLPAGATLRLQSNALVCGGLIRALGHELEAPQLLAMGTEFEAVERSLGFLFLE